MVPQDFHHSQLLEAGARFTTLGLGAYCVFMAISLLPHAVGAAMSDASEAPTFRDGL